MENMIQVEHLTKIYSSQVMAVRDVSFSVGEGETFGLLGPNGAGKTTIIMILTTLLKPTSGTARVAGIDVRENPYGVRLKLGYVSQDLAVDDNLTGWDNLYLQANFYHLPKNIIKEKCTEVLRLVGLEKRADDLVETYSGGMRKRLDLATGLLHEPRALFLDEPTLGLDVQTRQQIWKYIEFLRSEKKMTVLLTTHYMEEAEKLCDRVAIIDRGEIKAIDTPDRLKEAIGGDLVTISFSPGEEEKQEKALKAIEELPFVNGIESRQKNYVILVKNGEKAIPSLFQVLNEMGVKVENLNLKKPTLADVYLHFTGQELRDESWSKEQAIKSAAMRKRIRG